MADHDLAWALATSSLDGRAGRRAILLAVLTLDDLELRNTDNVTRTESYLELYALAREDGPDLPWILMAHLVSRNTGYLLGDLAERIPKRRAKGDDASADAMTSLALLLERGNRVIFDDAFRHVVGHLRRRRGLPPVDAERSTVFMREAYARYERDGGERALVLDLVHNEQNVIERRVVHAPRFAMGQRLLGLIELSGREGPLHFPPVAPGLPEIRVGGFADLAKRIDAGARIFDGVVGPHRDALFRWALEHPHDGSRAAYGGPSTPRVRDAWPVATLRALDAGIHAPVEVDEAFP